LGCCYFSFGVAGSSVASVQVEASLLPFNVKF